MYGQKEVTDWIEESVSCQQECYECMDQGKFEESCDDLDELTFVHILPRHDDPL